ncbi:hypothetical protein BDA96_02G422700 [Sorghum bicolor]|uniref:Bifunctional inhibitor/plant lipid transfer protein/seed storage helical domain-containing protein n=1 Tax=Sorghum bicolor TaxID=4558 RepID=A0A921UY86_SORBI|nr:hypothetical protein BDA96_02G422700 [Sorghum bicolor]
MAPSNKSFLVLLLLAVVAAPWLVQPSSAAAFSFPPIFPCIPGFPRIPLFPCVEPPPLPAPPTECRSHLMKMMPCAGYLTNSSVTVPPSACCDGFSQVSADLAAICFCHVANGDIQQLLPAPMIFKRMLAITDQCGVNLRMEALVQHCDEFEGVPPMTLPSPPPSAA